ncbi:unnamed protein product [Urochloa humidicola]
MDPNTKMLLDEMKKIGDRFSLVETRVTSLESTLGDRLTKIEESNQELITWKTEIDSTITDLAAKVESVDSLVAKVESVDDLASKVGLLNKQIDRVVVDRRASGAGIFPNPESTAATSSAGNPVVGPDGHRLDLRNQENGLGSLTTLPHLPGKGRSWGFLQTKGV